VELIGRVAGDRVAADTGPGLTGSGAGAEVAVGADRSVRLGVGLATVGGLVADPVVALVGRPGTVPRRAPAHARGAHVAHRAEAAVGAGGPVRCRRGCAHAPRPGSGARVVGPVPRPPPHRAGRPADPPLAGVGTRPGPALASP